ncbi:MAG: electron transfer flavoprotein subunit alpha/FixB family protein, partial [Robiginitomaculum sp.]|nr:electron transfer flavoprotein subunit alpha/FixB family protein [Robiginitomaculum sp.]
MQALVIAEHNNTNLNDATGKTVTAALAMGGKVDILVIGSGVGDVAKEAAALNGVRAVLIADDASLIHAVAERIEALVVPLMADYDAVLAPATTSGKNFMPRIAAKLDVMQISEITKVLSADTFVRPIYAGNAMQTVKSTDDKK